MGQRGRTNDHLDRKPYSWPKMDYAQFGGRIQYYKGGTFLMNSTCQVFFRNCYATEFLIDEDKNVRTNKMNVVFKWLQRNYFLQMFDSGCDCSNADSFDTQKIQFRGEKISQNAFKICIFIHFRNESLTMIPISSSVNRSDYPFKHKTTILASQ